MDSAPGGSQQVHYRLRLHHQCRLPASCDAHGVARCQQEGGVLESTCGQPIMCVLTRTRPGERGSEGVALQPAALKLFAVKAIVAPADHVMQLMQQPLLEQPGVQDEQGRPLLSGPDVSPEGAIYPTPLEQGGVAYLDNFTLGPYYGWARAPGSAKRPSHTQGLGELGEERGRSRRTTPHKPDEDMGEAGAAGAGAGGAGASGGAQGAGGPSRSASLSGVASRDDAPSVGMPGVSASTANTPSEDLGPDSGDPRVGAGESAAGARAQGAAGGGGVASSSGRVFEADPAAGGAAARAVPRELCLMAQLLKRGSREGEWHAFNIPHLVSRPFQVLPAAAFAAQQQFEAQRQLGASTSHPLSSSLHARRGGSVGGDVGYRQQQLGQHGPSLLSTLPLNASGGVPERRAASHSSGPMASWQSMSLQQQQQQQQLAQRMTLRPRRRSCLSRGDAAADEVSPGGPQPPASAPIPKLEPSGGGAMGPVGLLRSPVSHSGPVGGARALASSGSLGPGSAFNMGGSGLGWAPGGAAAGEGGLLGAGAGAGTGAAGAAGGGLYPRLSTGLTGLVPGQAPGNANSILDQSMGLQELMEELESQPLCLDELMEMEGPPKRVRSSFASGSSVCAPAFASELSGSSMQASGLSTPHYANTMQLEGHMAARGSNSSSLAASLIPSRRTSGFTGSGPVLSGSGAALLTSPSPRGLALQAPGQGLQPQGYHSQHGGMLGYRPEPVLEDLMEEQQHQGSFSMQAGPRYPTLGRTSGSGAALRGFGGGGGGAGSFSGGGPPHRISSGGPGPVMATLMATASGRLPSNSGVAGRPPSTSGTAGGPTALRSGSLGTHGSASDVLEHLLGAPGALDAALDRMVAEQRLQDSEQQLLRQGGLEPQHAHTAWQGAQGAQSASPMSHHSGAQEQARRSSGADSMQLN